MESLSGNACMSATQASEVSDMDWHNIVIPILMILCVIGYIFDVRRDK